MSLSRGRRRISVSVADVTELWPTRPLQPSRFVTTTSTFPSRVFLSRLVYTLYTLFFAPTTIPRVWLPRYPCKYIYIYISLSLSLSFAQLTKDVRTSAFVTRLPDRVTDSPTLPLRNSLVACRSQFFHFLNECRLHLFLFFPSFFFREEFIMQTALKLFYKNLVFSKNFKKQLYRFPCSK